MKNITLKKRSWHFFLYSKVFGFKGSTSGITNLCPYFWKVILALISLPLTWVSLFWPIKRRDEGFSYSLLMTYIPYVTLLLGTVIGQVISEKMEWDWITFNVIIQCAVGVAIIALGISLFVSIIAAGCWLDDKQAGLRAKRFFDGEKPTKSIFKVKWSAFKGKYCPSIN